MSRPPLLELHSASLVRGDTVVLQALTLSIAQGEHTAIVGPNGAGKSSLIRLLTADNYPVVSENGIPPVRILGRDRWDLSELRQQLGVVSPDLYARFTGGGWTWRVRALEAVVSGFFGSQAVFEHHRVTPEMTDKAREALDRVGGRHLADKRLDQMSTGESRRVLIARALVTTPAALVLDEPTMGLDVVARHRFMERVRQIATSGTTVLLVTQHIDEIFPEMKRVILLHEGRIAADGPSEQVIRGRTLEIVFGAPLMVAESSGYFHVRPAAPEV